MQVKEQQQNCSNRYDYAAVNARKVIHKAKNPVQVRGPNSSPTVTMQRLGSDSNLRPSSMTCTFIGPCFIFDLNNGHGQQMTILTSIFYFQQYPVTPKIISWRKCQTVITNKIKGMWSMTWKQENKSKINSNIHCDAHIQPNTQRQILRK